MSVAISSLLTRSRQLIRVVRFSPFDTSTEEGRSQERMRRAGLTAIAGMLSKVIAILTTLVTIPLTLNYLGAERYGVWMSISATVTMLSFADLGIGNGLLTSIAKAHGDEDKHLAARYVSSAFFFLMLMAAGLFGIFAVMSPFVAWGTVFNVHDPTVVRSLAPTVTVVVAMFVLNMPLCTVQRTQAGYQEGFQSSLWQCVGSVGTMLAVYLATWQKASLPVLVLCLMGAPLLVLLANWISFFAVQHRWLLPHTKHWDKQIALTLMRTGFLFFVLQISMSLAFASDNVVAAHTLGQDAVTQLAVTARLFSMISLPLAMILQPLWPAYGEAVARGDLDWVKRTLRRSLRLALGVTVLPGLFLALFGNHVLHLWVGSQVVAPQSLLWALGIWTVINGLAAAFSMFLNGIGEVRLQVVVALIFGFGALAGKLLLAPVWGMAGIIWASVIVGAFVIILPYSLLVPKLVPRLAARDAGDRAEVIAC